MDTAPPPVTRPSRDRARAMRGGRSGTRSSELRHRPSSEIRWPGAPRTTIRTPPLRVPVRPGSTTAVRPTRPLPFGRLTIAPALRTRIAASMLCTSAMCASAAGVLAWTHDDSTAPSTDGAATLGRPDRAVTATGRSTDARSRSASAPSARSGAAAAAAGGRGAAPAPRRATLAFTGDVLIHGPVARRAKAEAAENGTSGYDFADMFAPIRERISYASLAICHMETPISATDQDLHGYPMFRAPREIADGLRHAGYDGCSTASNHSLDTGTKGVGTTLDVLDAAGLEHAGTARSADEATTPARYEAAGIRVAHLSYAYGFNGFHIPAGEPWAANEIDPDRIIADAKAARAAGAEFVVASLHWGTEYQHDPTAAQQQVAQALAASGTVDLVVGHHAHVIQPVTRIGKMWVIYGLGNILSNNGAGPGGPAATDGLIATVTVADHDGHPAVEKVAVTPTYNEKGTFRILPVADALAVPGIAPKLAAELRKSWDRTMGYVLRLDGTALGVEADRTPPPA